MNAIGVIAGATRLLAATAVLGVTSLAVAAPPLLWTERGPSFTPLDPPPNASIGASAALSGDTVVLGGSSSIYVFTRDGSGWAQQGAPFISDATQQGDDFSAHVAVSGDTIVATASAWGTDTTFNQGAAFVFVRSAGAWAQQGPGLLASDGASNYAFGSSVALDGDTFVAGSPQFRIGTDTNQINRGAAYVFFRSGATWSQQAELLASDGFFYDLLGSSVAISGDTAIVGAPDKTVGANTYQGAAYVFVRSGTTWTQQARLTNSDGAMNDFLGSAVAISGDTALVGAEYKTVNGNTFQGAAYVFVRSGTTWTQQGPALVVSDGQMNDQLGDQVALSGDTAVIGSALGRGHGLAYVFARSGTTWTQQGPSLAPLDYNPSVPAFFGSGLAVEGSTVLVAASEQPNGPVTGAAYIFSDLCSANADCTTDGYCDAQGSCRTGVPPGGAMGDAGAPSTVGNAGAPSTVGDAGASSTVGNAGTPSAIGDGGASSTTGDAGAPSTAGSTNVASGAGSAGKPSSAGDAGAPSGAPPAIDDASCSCRLARSTKNQDEPSAYWLLLALSVTCLKRKSRAFLALNRRL